MRGDTGRHEMSLRKIHSFHDYNLPPGQVPYIFMAAGRAVSLDPHAGVAGNFNSLNNEARVKGPL